MSPSSALKFSLGSPSAPVSNAVVPERTELLAAYPNPFNPETTINYNLAETAEVDIQIYKLLGKQVYHLINNERPHKGEHFINWNALDNHDKEMTSGIYFVVLKEGNQMKAMKIQLLR